MKMIKDYAEEILSLIAITDSDGMLPSNCVVTELLCDIAREWPSLVQDYGDIFARYAQSQWWLQLPKSFREAPPADRPPKPVDWFSEDKTIEGIG